MKLLFCDNSLKELLNFRGDIINHYSDLGYNIVLVAPVNTDINSGETSYSVRDIKIRRNGMNPIADILYFIRLLTIYFKEKPDIVFHYTIKPNIYGTFAAKLLSIPSVAMITGLGYVFNHPGFKTRLAKNLYKFAIKFSSRILVLNDENKNILTNSIVGIQEKIILLSGGEGVNLKKFRDD